MKNNILHNTFFILLALFTISSCSGQKTVTDTSYGIMLHTLLEHNVNEISVAEIPKNTSNTIFLDTREKEEYNISHIKNAIWVGYDNQDLSKLSFPKSTKIIAYCSVGYRSEKTTQRLNNLGYTNVSNLYGGLFEWVNQDHPIYSTSKVETKKVHAYSYSWGKWLNKGIKVY